MKYQQCFFLQNTSLGTSISCQRSGGLMAHNGHAWHCNVVYSLGFNKSRSSRWLLVGVGSSNSSLCNTHCKLNPLRSLRPLKDSIQAQANNVKLHTVYDCCTQLLKTTATLMGKTTVPLLFQIVTQMLKDFFKPAQTRRESGQRSKLSNWRIV